MGTWGNSVSVSPCCFSPCCAREMEHLSGIPKVPNHLQSLPCEGNPPTKYCSEVAALKWQHQSPFGLLIASWDSPAMKAPCCLLMEDSPGQPSWPGPSRVVQISPGFWACGILALHSAAVLLLDPGDQWSSAISPLGSAVFLVGPSGPISLDFSPQSWVSFQALPSLAAPPFCSLVEPPLVTCNWGGRKSAISFPSDIAKLCFLLHSGLLFLIFRAYFGFFFNKKKRYFFVVIIRPHLEAIAFTN